MVNGTYLSPVKIYKFKRNKSDCLNLKCSEKFITKWAHRDSCSMQIMCPKLGQLVCGSYGLSIGKVDICSRGMQYVVNIKSEVHLEFWTTAASKPDIECYIWCDTQKDFKAKQSVGS